MSTANMNVGQVMSGNVTYIPRDTCIRDAALKMKELDCGFLPIANSAQDKLMGVVTDRDVVIRSVAEGRNPFETTVDEIKSDSVLYCFRDDPIEKAAQSMQDQQVYRLVVLDGEESKQLCGVISLNDIVRHRERDMAATAAEGIAG
ncbi:MAG: CBS domain-containing protein [Halieaceae bacterium]|jgi:CBS domain-containing protein|nr:CBS domain-containing protein [Halieaceae bacterium]